MPIEISEQICPSDECKNNILAVERKYVGVMQNSVICGSLQREKDFRRGDQTGKVIVCGTMLIRGLHAVADQEPHWGGGAVLPIPQTTSGHAFILETRTFRDWDLSTVDSRPWIRDCLHGAILVHSVSSLFMFRYYQSLKISPQIVPFRYL